MGSWNPRQLLGMIPGADLLRQAWDATKLVGAIIDRRKEKALVLSEERNKAVRKYKDKQANKQVKELFLEAKYEELSRLYLPHLVVDKGKDLVEACSQRAEGIYLCSKWGKHHQQKKGKTGSI